MKMTNALTLGRTNYRIELNPLTNGMSPLCFAAKHGHADVVNQLLAKDGVDVNHVDNKETPLFAAAFRGHIEVVRLLLAKDSIDVNQPDKGGFTPLACCCPEWACRYCGAVIS